MWLFLTKLGATTVVVFVFIWLAMNATSAFLDAMGGKPLRYTVRGLLIHTTAIAVVLALIAGILQSPL